MLISYRGQCLTPYFAYLSNNVARFACRKNASFYANLISEMQNIRNKVKHFPFEDHPGMLLAANKMVKNHPEFSNFSVVVSFDMMDDRSMIEVLKLCLPNGFLLILDNKNGFLTAKIDRSENKCTLVKDILAYEEQILYKVPAYEDKISA